MPLPFVEYRDVEISEPLRQGDVLEAVDPEVSKWRRTLFVLTADCDLAHEKNRGRLTCVPLLEQSEYLLELVVPRLQERVRKKAVQELQDLMRSHGVEHVSNDRLVEWIAEESAASIATAIGVPAEGLSRATRLIEAVSLAGGEHSTVREAIEALMNAQMRAKVPPKVHNARRNLIDVLRDAYKNPPGDTLFLSAIARGRHDGYFAYLRQVEQVMQPSVSTAPTRAGVDYRRIARLEDRFTHALVQRFAMVYLSIGLPPEYEEVRDIHAELVGEE